MLIVRLRLIGSNKDADSLIAVLYGIKHIEQVADLIPHNGVSDPSSAVSGMHEIEFEVRDLLWAGRAREIFGIAAELLDAGSEFVDKF